MKLLNYIQNEQVKLGVKTPSGIVDVGLMVSALGLDVPSSMALLIEKGQEGIRALENCLEVGDLSSYYIVSEEADIQYAPIVLSPEKILCIGLNYKSHSEECQMDLPENPVIFSKFNNALAGHRQTVNMPETTQQMDYEAELVMVIGKTAKNVSREEALDFVFGYSVGNDLSARDLQFRTPQWLLGKTCDHFAPTGPILVTADEIDPNALNISCKVNGEIKQSSNTKDMIFDCATIISYLSQHMTLKPGDLIFTGTPSGVILGYPESERVWLKNGDLIVVEIEKIGILENRIGK